MKSSKSFYIIDLHESFKKGEVIMMKKFLFIGALISIAFLISSCAGLISQPVNLSGKWVFVLPDFFYVNVTQNGSSVTFEYSGVKTYHYDSYVSTHKTNVSGTGILKNKKLVGNLRVINEDELSYFNGESTVTDNNKSDIEFEISADILTNDSLQGVATVKSYYSNNSYYTWVESVGESINLIANRIP